MPRLMVELLPFTPHSVAVHVSFVYPTSCIYKHQQTTKSALGTEASTVLQPVISLGLRVETIRIFLVH